jgi:hypothetical protein
MNSASNISSTNDVLPQTANKIRNSRFIEHPDDYGEPQGELAPPLSFQEPDVNALRNTSHRSRNSHVTSLATYQGRVEEASFSSSGTSEQNSDVLNSNKDSSLDISQAPPTANTEQPNVTRSALKKQLLLELILASQTPLPNSQSSDESCHSDSQDGENNDQENAEQNWFSGIMDDLDSAELERSESTSQDPTYASSSDISIPPLPLGPPIIPISNPLELSFNLPLESSETPEPADEVAEVAEALDEDPSRAQEEEEWQEVYLSQSQEASQDPNSTNLPEVVVRALNPQGRPLGASRESRYRRGSLLSTEILQEGGREEVG